MKIRQPYVANKFYPGTKEGIVSLLDSIVKKEAAKPEESILNSTLTGGIVPHAGYVYSGYEAVHFFEYVRSANERFDTFFILYPDHGGLGASVSLDENDAWLTPLGETEIDRDFYPYLNLPEDSLPHQYEHSGEVILPMLQYFLPYSFKIVPVSMSEQNPETARMTANAIIEANNILKKKILVIASSDFSHYVSPDKGEKMDATVIDAILKMDLDDVYNQVKKNNVSVCGYGPIMALLAYNRIVSASPRIKLLRRGHSGEVYPSEEVVFYTSFLCYESK